ncbi:MAG TPA: ABC transporter substrate-binding protein [Streptosporangiaceae bacterium]|nr:ABC transporter substrate-binding protein [Streptosporangiaceae bacterium]
MVRSDGNGGLLSGAVALDRRQFLRGVTVAGAAVGASSLIAACSGSSSTKAASTIGTTVRKRGGDLKVGLSGSDGEDTLDPHAAETFIDSARAQALYQPLLQMNAQALSEMVLAETITPTTASEWIIKLRSGISFHSGKPLTAEDVIYTFRRVKTGGPGGTPFSGANALGPMDLGGLKALDNLTVKVPFTSPYSSFLEQLQYWYFLYIVPDGFNPAKQTPNGTGPFVYQSFTPNQRSVFTRNKNFWQSGVPYVDSLTVIDFPDTTSLQDALSTGAIDAATGFDGPQLSALSTVSGVTALPSHAGSITPFTMRVDQPPFNDVRVRQAMRLLVDRPQLIDSALDGYGVVASDVYSPNDPDFNHALHREQDIPQAKHLLKAAGHENLTVTLVTAAASTGMVAMATVLKEQALAAGVTINLSDVAVSTFFGKNYLSWPFSQDFYSYNPYLMQVSTCMLSASPFNETHTNSPTLTNLYEQANATLDASVQKEIEYQMQAYDFNEGGYIIPAFLDTLDAYSNKITGYAASASGVPLSNLDFENWSFV